MLNKVVLYLQKMIYGGVSGVANGGIKRLQYASLKSVYKEIYITHLSMVCTLSIPSPHYPCSKPDAVTETIFSIQTSPQLVVAKRHNICEVTEILFVGEGRHSLL